MADVGIAGLKEFIVRLLKERDKGDLVRLESS